MARQFIYHMQGMTKSYSGGKKVLEDIHLSFYPDAKIGVLGPNGAGKSTLLRIMAGIDKEFTGEAWLADGATCGYLPQEPKLDETKNVMGNVMEGVAEKQAILDRYNELAMNYSDETADEMTKLQDEIDAQNLWDLESQVEQAMDALRCPPGDADVSKLSGGERRRVALTQLLLRKPDLLLLDEPTNHLDVAAREALVTALNNYEGAVILISHDRHLIEASVDRLWLVDDGTVKAYDGDLDSYSQLILEKSRTARREAKRDTRGPNVKAEKKAPEQPKINLVQLKKQIQQQDHKMLELQEKINILDKALQDPQMYAAQPKKAADFARLRAKLADDLETTELDWLKDTETYEQLVAG